MFPSAPVEKHHLKWRYYCVQTGVIVSVLNSGPRGSHLVGQRGGRLGEESLVRAMHVGPEGARPHAPKDAVASPKEKGGRRKTSRRQETRQPECLPPSSTPPPHPCMTHEIATGRPTHQTTEVRKGARRRDPDSRLTCSLGRKRQGPRCIQSAVHGGGWPARSLSLAAPEEPCNASRRRVRVGTGMASCSEDTTQRPV